MPTRELRRLPCLTSVCIEDESHSWLWHLLLQTRHSSPLLHVECRKPVHVVKLLSFTICPAIKLQPHWLSLGPVPRHFKTSSGISILQVFRGPDTARLSTILSSCTHGTRTCARMGTNKSQGKQLTKVEQLFGIPKELS